MARDRDVGAFHRRAPGYEAGWLGRLHRQIAEGVVELALDLCPGPTSVLDVGCGTGYALRRLGQRLGPEADLRGLDPAPGMVAEARRRCAGDPRIRLGEGWAEGLPYPSASFDLVLATTTFDHWRDQARGLQECSRVLRPRGLLLLTDVFPPRWLRPWARPGSARGRGEAGVLLGRAGFQDLRWRRPPGLAWPAGLLLATVSGRRRGGAA